MYYQNKSSEGMGLGIAGLVLGILSIPLSIIGCTFVSGAVLGILGISFSAIGYSQAKKANAQTGLIMAGLIVSIIGFSFAILRFSSNLSNKHLFPWRNIKDNIEMIDENASHFEHAFEKEFENEIGGDLETILEELEDDLNDELDDLDSTIELNLENLDDLEESLDEALDNLSDEEKAKKLGKVAGRAVRVFIDELKDSSNTNSK